MSFYYLDLESRSDLDVTKVGAFAYWEHPSTEVLCIASAVDDGMVVLTERLDVPLWMPPPGVVMVAHNDDFERNALRRLGIDPDQWEWCDTAALSARMSLPRSLEDLAEFLWPDDPTKHKDMVGNRVMKKLAKRRTNGAWWTEEDKPEDFAILYDYCAKDVVVMREAHKRLMPLDPQEKRIAALTRKMNARGVRIDAEAIAPAQAALEEYATPLAAEFRAITGVPVKSPAAAAKVFGLEDMRKPTVRKALRGDLDPALRRGLEIHVQLSRSSTAKLAAMQRRTSKDGRLRGAMVYCGAERTGRWSSMGVQLQNFPRGLGKETDLAFHALHAGVLDVVFTGMERPAPAKPLDPVGAVAEMLRGYLVGPFIVGDLAQIEARGLAYLAKQDDLVKIFAAGGDPYCVMASSIYGRTITKKDKDERFMGKQVVLGAGYGVGWRGFKNLLDETYDVAVSDEFAKKVINTYRAKNKRITAFWARLENGFKFALRNKSQRIRVTDNICMGTLEYGGIPYAFIELPSGRRLYYARPELKDDEIRYFGRDIKRGGAWGRINTYGGKLAENVTQAFSRDVLAEGMLRLDAAGFPLEGTVHDEVISEPPEDIEDAASLFHRMMVQVPEWAPGLPIEAEVFESYRYRK